MNKFFCNKRILGILVVASLILSSLSTSIVSASSQYDGVVRITSNLVIDSPSYAGSKDITQSWFSGVLNGDNDLRVDSTCTQDIRDSLLDSVGDGSMAVSQFESSGEKSIIAYWRNDHLSSTFFTNRGDIKTLEIPSSGHSAGEGYYSAIFYQYAANNYAVMCTRGLFSSLISSADSTPDIDFKMFLFTFNVNYPSDYEGLPVPNGVNDVDNDGLIEARELIQGTSDANKDSDSDGLNDYAPIYFTDPTFI